MPLHTIENQYRGVNAHLHSYFQQRGDWTIFHGLHITHVSEALQQILGPTSGYVAVPERSIQITRRELDTGRMVRSMTIPEVGVYKNYQGGTTLQQPQTGNPGAVLDLADTLLEPENLRGIVIREVKAGELGDIVTRIELLSPSNKPPRSDFYLEKRDETLLSGINLIEIDYLHETRSAIYVIPDYPKREPFAYPYLITVSVPHPTPDEGKVYVYGFRVDDPIHAITIPLQHDDVISFDPNIVYHHTFQTHYVFGLTLTDYEQPPLNFEAYAAEDQKRITLIMERAAQKVKNNDAH